ncbi:MAG: hypothetical protein ACI9IZ_002021 [Nonlabens sp.]|jgi:hypothetical protein
MANFKHCLSLKSVLIMKLTLIVLAFLLSVTTVQAQEWEVYKNETLEFRAAYPDTPDKTVQKVSTALGELDMHMIMYAPSSGDDNAVYAVIRSDYPKSQFEGADSEMYTKVLDGAVEGARSNLKGTLIFDKTVTFNGFHGRNIKIEITGAYVYMNAILAYNTMFITQVICSTEKDNNTSIQKFLNSFDIIKIRGY